MTLWRQAVSLAWGEMPAEAAKTGQIPTIRIGRRLLVPKAALERMLNTGGGFTSAPELTG